MGAGMILLPQELLIAVFKAQASVPDVVHLSKTCRHLYNTFESSKESILFHVSLQNIECHKDALRLAAQQEKISPLIPSTPDISLHKRLHDNAIEASFVLQNAGQYCKSAAIQPGPSSSSSSSSSSTSSAPSSGGNQAAGTSGQVTCSVHLPDSYTGGAPPPLLDRERERILTCWYYLKLLAHAHRHPNALAIEDEEAAFRGSVGKVVKDGPLDINSNSNNNMASMSSINGPATSALTGWGQPSIDNATQVPLSEPIPSLLQRMIGEIRVMSVTHLYVLWYITVYLFHFRTEAFARELGLETYFDQEDEQDQHAPFPRSTSAPHQPFRRAPGAVPPPGTQLGPSNKKPWDNVWDRVVCEYTYMRRYWQDRNERFLEGPCERCFVARGSKGGRCKARREGIGLWEV